MEDGRWEMEDGRWMMDDSPLDGSEGIRGGAIR